MSEPLKEPNRYVKFAILSNHFETCREKDDCIICSDYSKIYLGFYKLFFQLLEKEKKQTPREELLQQVAEYEQIAKDRLIETFEWVNVLETLDMDEREDLMELYVKIGQHPNMIQTYRERLGLVTVTFHTVIESKQVAISKGTTVKQFLTKQEIDPNKIRSNYDERCVGCVWLMLNDSTIVPADFDTIVLKDADVLKLIPFTRGGHSYE